MIVDYRLVAEAQRLAGAHVHTVAGHLTVYQLGCDVLERIGANDSHRPGITKNVRDAETWVRSFVCRERQREFDLSCRTPPS